ncbi:hypothetical protein GGQ05_000841 [Salinibacter ruber]|jgi:hypothetical protein|nr:hypothetical protein [Salinibacter ruber]MCS4169397.1 hypothetical protein [Salinibacter ruber]
MNEKSPRVKELEDQLNKVDARVRKRVWVIKKWRTMKKWLLGWSSEL